jgi:hypothetical protein
MTKADISVRQFPQGCPSGAPKGNLFRAALR